MFGTGQKAMLDLGRTTYKPDEILWVALNSIAESGVQAEQQLWGTSWVGGNVSIENLEARASRADGFRCPCVFLT